MNTSELQPFKQSRAIAFLEMDVALSHVCLQIMLDELVTREINKEDVCNQLFPNARSCPFIQVVFYWPRNAVALKVMTGDTYRQLFYFRIQGCTTIKVAMVLAKRMYDKLKMMGPDWAHTNEATGFRDVLVNSAFHAHSMLAA